MLWQASVLRFTAFPVSFGSVAPEEWWKSAVGEEPDTLEKQLKQSVTKITGRYGAGKVVLHVQPGRIDWLYTPTDDTPLRGSLGAFGDCLELFNSLLFQWFDTVQLPAMHRVALGSIMHEPVDTRDDGYATLRPLLKSVEIREGVSDFFYQINVPTQVMLDDNMHYGINRLTKWSVAAVETVNASFAPSSPMSSIATATDFFAQVELDINTIPGEATLFNASALPLLLKQLAAISVDIAEHGEPE